LEACFKTLEQGRSDFIIWDKLSPTLAKELETIRIIGIELAVTTSHYFSFLTDIIKLSRNTEKVKSKVKSL